MCRNSWVMVAVSLMLTPLGYTGWFYTAVALAAALNSILSLKLSHTLRYSADPPEGFETTDTIMSISVLAKLRRPR